MSDQPARDRRDFLPPLPEVEAPVNGKRRPDYLPTEELLAGTRLEGWNSSPWFSGKTNAKEKAEKPGLTAAPKPPLTAREDARPARGTRSGATANGTSTWSGVNPNATQNGTVRGPGARPHPLAAPEKAKRKWSVGRIIGIFLYIFFLGLLLALAAAAGYTYAPNNSLQNVGKVNDLNRRLQTAQDALEGAQAQSKLLTTRVDEVAKQRDQLAKDLKSAIDNPAAFAGDRGGLRIASNPPGAKVDVGAQASGIAPTTINNILAGKYKVNVDLDFYEPLTVEAEVTKDKVLELGTVNLVRSNGSLRVDSSPPGASFSLEAPGQAVRTGVTPMTLDSLPAGPYHLTVAQAGFPTLVQDVNVTGRGVPTVFNWVFGQGELDITCNPPGAVLLVDGKIVGSAPLKVKLLSGSHELGIYYQSMLAKRQTFTITAGQTTSLPFELPLAFCNFVAKPDGSDIWLGNLYIGQTPKQVSLPGGTFEMWTFNPAYAGDKRVVKFDNGEIRQVDVNLTTALPTEMPNRKLEANDWYLEIYVEYRLGKKLAENGQNVLAFASYLHALQRFREFQKVFAGYETAIVASRIRFLESELDRLRKVSQTPVNK